MEEENCVKKNIVINEPDIKSINKQGVVFCLLHSKQSRKNAVKPSNYLVYQVNRDFRVFYIRGRP